MPDAALAVLAVDVLDHLFAAIARGEIEVDVGHAIGGVGGALDPLLGQEALEQQLHPHRIDGGDAERVTEGRVGGRAAPLHEDAPPAGVFDDVPDQQEVAGQPQRADDAQLVLELAAGLVGERAVSARGRPSR